MLACQLSAWIPKKRSYWAISIAKARLTPTKPSRSMTTISAVPDPVWSSRTGSYDVGKNKGFVHLNTSHDTSELACESIAAWWVQEGRADYPLAKKLLLLCDGGGSNSATMYLFKEDLQKLANRLGIEIRVTSYPPYCSKFNPIEHRLFPHLTRACTA